MIAENSAAYILDLATDKLKLFFSHVHALSGTEIGETDDPFMALLVRNKGVFLERRRLHTQTLPRTQMTSSILLLLSEGNLFALARRNDTERSFMTCSDRACRCLE